MKNKLFEEIVIALSLSNLLFMISWAVILYPTYEAYHLKQYASSYLGIILNVLSLAGIFLGSLWLSRILNKGKTPVITKLIFLGVFGISLNGIRILLYSSETESNVYLRILIFAFILFAGIFAILKWRDALVRFSQKLLLAFTPFILVTFSQALWGIYTSYPDEVSIKTQLSAIHPKEKPNIKNRIIWIIFDEFDYFVAFGNSSSKVDLPEFAKLKKQSLFATNAYSPGYFTLEAMPSLLTGRKVEKSRPQGKNELQLKLNGVNDTVKFSETPNIFTEVQKMGGATGLIGWYHSYCRTIGKDLSACHWESLDNTQRFDKDQLSKLNKYSTTTILLKNFSNCLISFPFGYRLFRLVDPYLHPGTMQTEYINRHYRMINDSKEVISDPNIDLALIHLPVPHFPSYFNSSKNEFSQTETNYSENLILSDRVLGELRKTLEDHNLWEDSIIIVSSDHQLRINELKKQVSQNDLSITEGTEHPNIPFILKLKGNKESLTYEKPFNTVITHDLILAIMKGEISTTEEVTNWLDKNSDR